MFEGNERLIGRFAAVKIREVSAVTLFGEIETSETISRGTVR